MTCQEERQRGIKKKGKMSLNKKEGKKKRKEKKRKAERQKERKEKRLTTLLSYSV